jgi:hypothetical protein
MRQGHIATHETPSDADNDSRYPEEEKKKEELEGFSYH